MPVRGLDQSKPLNDQPQLTTPSALNCWPIDSASGRQRFGIRPGKIVLGTTTAGSVYHAIPITYNTGSGASGATVEAIAVCGANGTYTAPLGTTFTAKITTDAGSLTWPNQASCALYQGFLYQASAGSSTVRRIELDGGSEEALAVTYYDPGPNTEPKGTVPTYCGIVVTHGNRLWLMGDRNYSHVWYASKMGDPTDWDYTNVTSAGAVTSTGETGGQIGEEIVAGISQSSHCLLIGTQTSVYAVLGNPRGGSVRRISDHVGPLGNTAWCNDAEGNTWMVTKRGLYRITPNGGAVIPESEAIPNELIGIDPADGDRVAIGYDHRWPGVHIFVDYATGTDKSFFKSFQTGGIFQQSFGTMPRCAVTFPKLLSDNTSSLVMLDGTNSFWFKRDHEDGVDTPETRTSYVYIPIPLADAGSEGVLHAITAALAYESDNCDWEIYVGKSAEQAFRQTTAAFTGTAWTWVNSSPDRYLNYWQNPMARGNFAYLKISVTDATDARWIVEQIVADIITPTGARKAQ